jgi:two-component system response regulator MprA
MSYDRAEGIWGVEDSSMSKNVLVVDDEAVIREFLSDVLVSAGYTVTEASDGMAALEAVERQRPAVVLTDIRMPRLDGIGLVERLRARGEHVPVVFMTAHFRTSPIPDIPLVPKPFDFDRLLATVAGVTACA